jgi:hypothetical protein
MAVKKLYLHAISINTFEWVDDPKRATKDAKDSLEVTLKQFHDAKVERAPRESQQIEPDWVITTEVEIK